MQYIPKLFVYNFRRFIKTDFLKGEICCALRKCISYCRRGNVTFLFRQESNQRMRHRGGATSQSALPYVPHPPHRQPVSKNVPIFEHLLHKNPKFFLCRHPKIGTFSGVGWRSGGSILKEGGAPRSESEINMIAGGNHTIIHAFVAPP